MAAENGQITDTGESAVEGAIHQVLAAEEAAMAEVQASHAEAERIVLEARRRASEISAESDAKISAIHKEMAKKTRKEVEEITLEYQRRLGFEGENRVGEGGLEAVVKRLAARLTGGEERAEAVDSGTPAEPEEEGA